MVIALIVVSIGFGIFGAGLATFAGLGPGLILVGYVLSGMIGSAGFILVQLAICMWRVPVTDAPIHHMKRPVRAPSDAPDHRSADMRSMTVSLPRAPNF